MTIWDERYGTAEYAYGTEPNEFLRANADCIPHGKVLCLAEGEGRNAVYLASQGHQVTAVDQSSVGLAKAQQLAGRSGVCIDTIAADLADFSFGAGIWDGIVSIWCHLPSPLRLRVHERIVAGLKAGGVLILEAYTPKQLEFASGGPPHRDLMITLDELYADFDVLQVIHAVEAERNVLEGRLHHGMSAVVQFIARKS